MNNERLPVRRALLSLSDKSGLEALAKKLAEKGVEILSTGGTAKSLKAQGIEPVEVGDYTGFAEVFEGRVKTLHPKIHGGLLYDRSKLEQTGDAKRLGIGAIDLLAVNLYPFEEGLEMSLSEEEMVERIDIGGPALIRAAAKNNRFVVVLTDTKDYAQVLEEWEEQGGIALETRRGLAAKAFAHTAYYDAMIADWFAKKANTPFSDQKTLGLTKISDLRYGENPHQNAALYHSPGKSRGALAKARLLQGKPMSYNNWNDADAALACLKELSAPACVIVKHANPAGAALAENPGEAYARALATDPVSAFGGILAFNRKLGKGEADVLLEKFYEVIMAPAFSEAALERFKSKPNLRLLQVDCESSPVPMQFKSLANGGWLVQSANRQCALQSTFLQLTRKAASQTALNDLDFAFRLAKHVTSNAIVFAKEGASLGIGAGQMSRVDSARLARDKARHFFGKEALRGSVAASDAFFPFADGLDLLIEAGVEAVIQPGGSLRDNEVIARADKAGIAMYFTGERHFRH